MGPDGQPARFDGAAWVSQDGRYFWNGAAWQPIKKPGFRPSGLVVVLGVFVLAVVGLFVFTRLSQPFEGEFVSNTKIDSPTQIEFDYSPGTSCNNLTFEYRFYDRSGTQVQVLSDTKGSRVDAVGGRIVTHFTISLEPEAISSNAVRFEAIAACHD